MDWIVFLILFAVQYGAGERDLTDSQCAWLGAITMVTYTATSLLVGMMLTRRNARALLLLSTVVTTVLGAGCLMLADFFVQLVCLGLLGVGLVSMSVSVILASRPPVTRENIDYPIVEMPQSEQ